MKKLGGFAVINDNTGKKIAFTYSEVDSNGFIVKSNQKGSYLVLDEAELKVIEQLEEKINLKLAEI